MAGVTWTVSVADVPADLDAPGAWALHGAADAARASDLALWGHDDLAHTARSMLARLHERRYAHRLRLVATGGRAPGSTPDPADVVGTASVVLPLQGDTHVAHVEVVVRPDRRSAGVGAALLAGAERLAREHGRTTVIAATEHRGEPDAADPAALVPPTGSGRVHRDDPGARFARRHGYAFEQAERYSVLTLPPEADVEGLHAAAAAAAGADHRLVHWLDAVPAEHLDDLAVLCTRMSTEVPLGDLEMGEDPWDADRVRAAEAATADAGHGTLTVAAEHVPSGRLVAFTMLEYPRDAPAVVFQEDTLVLPEHRGHRLGMLVKTAALGLLARERPGARRIHTWNAEENAPMLAINVALGFRPVGVAGLWQKRIDA